jgi:hypothetical protein
MPLAAGANRANLANGADCKCVARARRALLRQGQSDRIFRILKREHDFSTLHAVLPGKIHSFGAMSEDSGQVCLCGPILRLSKIKPGGSVAKQNPHNVRTKKVYSEPAHRCGQTNR